MSYTLRVHTREAEPYTDLADSADVEEACRQEATVEVGDYASEYVDLDDGPELAEDQSNADAILEFCNERTDEAVERLTTEMFRAVWDGAGEYRMRESRVRYSLVEEKDDDEEAQA